MEERVKILCVDDEVNVLRALERMFMDDDYEILTCSSAEEGLATLEKVQPIHIVISDYRMPIMNGVDFLREVCKHWPDTIRIVLSGYADTAAIVSAINDGQIYKFIPKPWNEDEVRVTIVNAIERYFLHQHNVQLLAELTRKNDELARINQILEEKVLERTRVLMLQNRVLSRAQNILDALPVAVLGIDPEGVVAQCNQECADLLGCELGQLVGSQADGALPTAFLDLIKPAGDGEQGRELVLRGMPLQVRIAALDEEGQQGTVVVLIRGEGH